MRGLSQATIHGPYRPYIEAARQYARNEGESSEDYWKRQRKLLAAVADARVGQESLALKFEFHSETFTAAVKSLASRR